MFTDYILNGQGHGLGAELSQIGRSGEMRFDPGLMRPFRNENGVPCCTVNTGRVEPVELIVNGQKRTVNRPVMETYSIRELEDMGYESPVFNATTLRKDEWQHLDSVVLTAARARLRVWTDLLNSNSYGGFNAMAKTILEHETVSDPGEAVVDMDGLTDGRSDDPLFKLEGLPLPITHSSFWYSKRRLMASRNSGTPLDTRSGEAAGRRVAEMVEKTVLGVQTGITYGTSTRYSRTSAVYGYLNFPNRLTKINLTVPTGSNPEATVSDVLAMRDQLYNANFFGPYMIYHSTDWDQYLDNDYARLGGNNASMTLRERLRSIEGIQDVRRADFLTAANSHAFTLLMVQMTSDTARAIDGMGITTVQWESKGGMRLDFKVMAIQVPQLRSDYYDKCGILHARTA